jgi:predicted MPP superfamily phosphohydrolase
VNRAHVFSHKRRGGPAATSRREYHVTEEMARWSQDQSARAPEPTRRRFLRTLVAAGVGIGAGGGAHGYLYERHRVGLTKADVPVAGLPAPLEGLRVALLTDLHLSAMVPARDIEHAVALVAAERPDLIVLGGDYVTEKDRQFMAPCAELLAPLVAPAGVFAALGNHDDEVEMVAQLRKRGIQVLDDARTTIQVRGEKIEMVGLKFWTRQTADITRLLRGATGWTMLLAHDPRRFGQATALNIPLMLSGHTHGGQIVLPALGALAARKFPIAEGLGVAENTAAFVSRGVGTVYVPCRINCPPEVALLTLHRRQQRA